MRNVIAINGTPSTGKTTLANSLHGFQVWNLNDFAKQHPEVIIEYDEACQCDVIDEELLTLRLRSALASLQQIIVIESHLADLIPEEYVLHCYVLEADVRELEKRLQQRNYSVQKIEENKLAEIMKECYIASVNAFGEQRVTAVPPQSLDETLKFVANDLQLRIDNNE